jgi:hypothetical protein
MGAESVALVVAVGAVAAGLVMAVRARTWRNRSAAVVVPVLALLLFGGPLLLWPCGENGCGAIVPIYWVALGAVLVALIALLVAEHRAVRRHK